MFEKRNPYQFVTDTKMDAYLYKQGRCVGKALTGIHQNELFESNPDGNTQSLRPVKSQIGVLFPVQAEFVRGYCGQICISSPQQLKKNPIYSRFVPGVYRPVLRPCDFCPNPAQTCLRYA